MAQSSLQAIRNKVRRLTRSLSEGMLTNAELDNYINTFVIYDFPEQLRLFNMQKTFTFYTQPYQDTYGTTDDPSDPFYNVQFDNFKNKYITVNPPVYIAGYQSLFMESRDQFYSIYPIINASISTL